MVTRESRNDPATDPPALNTLGNESADDDIAGEREPLKMHEDGDAPPPGALDTAFPDTSPTESAQSDPELFGDPGRLPGSRDPSVAGSMEDDGFPGPKNGSTPYDAEGTSGYEGE